jgi:hypothetical protein
MKFAPQKYKLIHFITATKKHNLQASIKVEGIEKLPSEQVRVLEVWLDLKLKWQAYARIAQQKGLAELSAFQRVMAFT